MKSKLLLFIAAWGASYGEAQVLFLGSCPTLARHVAFGGNDMPNARLLAVDDIDDKIQPVRLNSTEVGPEKGAFNAGVFRVTIKAGKSVAAKFALPSFLPPHDYDQYSPLVDSPEFVEYLHIHQTLGRLGLAPELHGYLMDSDALKLGARIKASGVKVGPGPYTVLLMNEIPNPWIVKTMDSPAAKIPAPDFVKQIDSSTLQRIIERIESIRKILDEIHIQANDPHFFIFVGDDGLLHVQLADLDAYRWLPKQKVKNNFSAEIDLLQEVWKQTTSEH